MINLLPPKEKEELFAEEAKRLTLVLVAVISLSLLCLIIILVFLKIYLLIQIDFQRTNLELIKKQAEDPQAQIIQEKVENFNQKLERITDFYEQKINLIEAIEELTKTIPEGIYLADLSYSKLSSQMILAGFAPSRELLVQFKKNLEEKEEFQEIYFPPSNWTEPINVNFTGVQINLSQ